MTRVCVVGVGLIGGSLGMALRRARGYRVVGLGRRPERLKAAKARGAIDVIAPDARTAVASADIIVLAVPVQAIVAAARRLAPLARPGAVFTDVGSAKAEVAAGMKKAFGRRRDIHFVGGHPMAGSERAGVENASAALFRGATCVITPGANAAAVKKVKRLWASAGARCVEIDARRHDALIALTSHLPHLLAFSLVSQVSAASKRDARVRALVAGSFRDMTRIAASDPDIWTGILDLNRGPIRDAFRAFVKTADRLRRLPPARLRSDIARLARVKKSW